MKNAVKYVCAAVTIASLGACGGGGGDESLPGEAQAPYTREDIRLVATLGLLLNVQAGSNGSLAPSFLGAALQSYATDTGGSKTIPQSGCGAGSGSARLTKAVARTGLAAGDEVVFTFDRCTLSASNTVLSGTVKVVLRSEVVNLSRDIDAPPPRDYNTTFDAVFTDFTYTYRGIANRYVGTARIGAAVAQAGNSFTTSFSVPAGQTLSLRTSGVGDPMTTTYRAGAAYTGSDTLSPNSGTRKLEGAVSLEFQGQTETFDIKVPTTLAGSVQSTGVFNATSGTIETKATERNLATSTTFSGLTAQVRGDTDRNGSLDLSFTAFGNDLYR